MDFEEVQKNIYISNTVQLPAWIVNLYSNFWVWVLDEHVEICWTWTSSYRQLQSQRLVVPRRSTSISCAACARNRSSRVSRLEVELSIQIVTHSEPQKDFEKLWQELKFARICKTYCHTDPYCTSWSLSVLLFTLHILHILFIYLSHPFFSNMQKASKSAKRDTPAISSSGRRSQGCERIWRWF